MLESDEIDFSIFSDKELSEMQNWNKEMIEVYIKSKNQLILEEIMKKHPKDRVLRWFRDLDIKLRERKKHNGSITKNSK